LAEKLEGKHKYIGMIEKKSNKPSGFGRLKSYTDDYVYFDGTFKDGQCHGHGMLIIFGVYAKVFL
jgi:hypothetical protein